MRNALLTVAAALVALAGCSDKGDSAALAAAEEAADFTLEPPEGGQGQTLDLSLRASRSSFVFGETELDLGEGVTIDSLTVDDGWSAVATVTIAEDAEAGLRDAAILIEGDTTTLTEAFRVRNDSFSISPDNAKMGETLQVQIYGENTEWLSGRTWVDFGDDIDVVEFTVYSETYAEARVAIEADATPGWRDVWTEDGAHVVTLYDGFLVDRTALAATWDPGDVVQGQEVEFTVVGRGTAFEEGATDIDFYLGDDRTEDIRLDFIQVLDGENLWGRMTVSNAAEIGGRNVYIITGEEGVWLEDAFTVEAGELALDQVAVSLEFNASGAINEYVNAQAIFFIPLDPPCPDPSELEECTNGRDDDDDGYVDCYDTDCETSMACALPGPQPYDQNMTVEGRATGGNTHDCPVPQTVSAGEHVWLESDANTVTLVQYTDGNTGMLYYAPEAALTMDDYVTGQWYDLHLEGDPDALPEEVVPAVQPTAPADWALYTPQLWGNYTHSRDEDFYFTWSPAQTYPTAIFAASLAGDSAAYEDESVPMSVSVLPWDDGVHAFPFYMLHYLKPSTAYFTAYAYIEGVYFGLAESIYQYNLTESYILLQGSLTLE